MRCLSAEIIFTQMEQHLLLSIVLSVLLQQEITVEVTFILPLT